MLFLLACARPEGALDTVPVASASLSDVELATYAIVGGLVNGSATLDIVRSDGASESHPVELNGSVLGVVIEVDTVVD